MNNESELSPLISICIPTYNGAEFLEECIQSALHQTYANLEILVSDDGSTDNTILILKKYQLHHQHIKLVNNTNRGMVNNWNNCIVKAKGKWIKFLFQDDVLKPECVAAMLQACAKQKTEVALCSRDFIIQENALPHFKEYFKEHVSLPVQIFGTTNYIEPETLADAVIKKLPENILGEPVCYLFNKDILAQTSHFYPGFKVLMDYEFIIRLGLIKGVAFLPESLVQFRVHAGSESSSNNKKSKEARLKDMGAEYGDFILLLHRFLNDPGFSLIKNKMGGSVLNNYLHHIYQSGCKHHGASLFNEAIRHVKENEQQLSNLKYNFFKYAWYRYLVKKWKRSKSDSVSC